MPDCSDDVVSVDTKSAQDLVSEVRFKQVPTYQPCQFGACAVVLA